MRYSDEEWSFMEDNRERSITGRSAHKQRTHNGKGGRVKLPHETMSRKELMNMNGEVKSWRINDPISWSEFKEMPNDLKLVYIKSIRAKFGTPDKYIAEMFGVGEKTLSMYLIDLKCNSGKKAGNGKKKWNKEGFYAWVAGAEAGVVNEEEVDIPDEDAQHPELISDDLVPEIKEETVEEYIVESPKFESAEENAPVEHFEERLPVTNVIPESGNLKFDNNSVESIIETIKMLLGKSIVDMRIEWRVRSFE